VNVYSAPKSELSWLDLLHFAKDDDRQRRLKACTNDRKELN